MEQTRLYITVISCIFLTVLKNCSNEVRRVHIEFNDHSLPSFIYLFIYNFFLFDFWNVFITRLEAPPFAICFFMLNPFLPEFIVNYRVCNIANNWWFLEISAVVLSITKSVIIYNSSNKYLLSPSAYRHGPPCKRCRVISTSKLVRTREWGYFWLLHIILVSWPHHTTQSLCVCTSIWQPRPSSISWLNLKYQNCAAHPIF